MVSMCGRKWLLPSTSVNTTEISGSYHELVHTFDHKISPVAIKTGLTGKFDDIVLM